MTRFDQLPERLGLKEKQELRLASFHKECKLSCSCGVAASVGVKENLKLGAVTCLWENRAWGCAIEVAKLGMWK